MSPRADPELRDLGERVLRLRQSRNWSRERLSEVSGLHYTFVGAIERGERNPTLRTLRRLAHALDVSVGRLAGDDHR